EIGRARPDIVPLRLGPARAAVDEFLIGAERDDVGMPERTGGSIVDRSDAGGKPFKPIEDRASRRRIGDRQGWFLAHSRPQSRGQANRSSQKRPTVSNEMAPRLLTATQTARVKTGTPVTTNIRHLSIRFCPRGNSRLCGPSLI